MVDIVHKCELSNRLTMFIDYLQCKKYFQIIVNIYSFLARNFMILILSVQCLLSCYECVVNVCNGNIYTGPSTMINGAEVIFSS